MDKSGFIVLMVIMKSKIKKIFVILQVLWLVSAGTLTTRANGVMLINTDIESLDNVFILDADDTGGDIKLQFGGTLDRYLKWDSANGYFSFNDNIDFQGNELKNFRIDNLSGAPLCDGFSIGRMYHNTTDSNSYICNGSIWEQIDIPAGSAITGVDSNTFTIDQDDTGGDVSLIFGSSLNQYLMWDDSESRFYLSGAMQMDGYLLPAVDDMYSLGSDDLRWKKIYLSEGLTVEDGDVSVGEGGFVVSFLNGQSGTGDTILPGHVVRVDTNIANAVTLTASQNNEPIGVARNSSAFSEVVEVIIIGKGTVSCTGTINTGNLMQTSSVPGAAKQGANSTKIVGTAVTNCSGGFLDAIIHLE